MSPKQKLIFGPHGADSTIVAKSALIKETWRFHKKFAPSFADYGWLLTVSPQISIGHSGEAIYYYRAHQFQMSRKAKDLSSWPDLTRVYTRHFSDVMKEEIFQKNELAKKFIGRPNVSLGLAFPAALPRLTPDERKIFQDLIGDLRKIFIFEDRNDARDFRILLERRGLFATRGRAIRYLTQLIPLLYEVAISVIKGVGPRFNR
jgi:hypothetical protein